MVVANPTKGVAGVGLGSSTLRCYVTIEGDKQGKFAGEAQDAAFTDRISALGFHYGVISPRDSVSGLASGKRQHQPVTFTKEWGAASPQIFQALVNSENLKNVLFEFVQPTPTGAQQVAYTVKLTNASLSKFDRHSGFDAAASQFPSDLRLLEDVSLTFQKIEIADALTKTAAVDDWQARV
jgi:type VI secretion system secreted protein Hcp